MGTCENKFECSRTAKEYAEQAADKAVHKTFAILGVDLDDPEALENFREDLRFGKRMRKAADNGLMTAVSVLTGSILIALWIGIIAQVRGAK